MSSTISKELLGKISSAGDKVNVYVNSKDKTIKCNPLNVKQQKELISTAVSGIEGVLNFNIYQNQIILDNTDDDELLVYDVIPIIAKLRIEALGNTIYNEGNTSSITVDDILNNVEDRSGTTFESTKVISFDGIELHLQIPTIKQDIMVTKKCLNEVKRSKDDDENTVGLLYIYELIKYVTKISVEGEDILFADISINNRRKIIESLNLKFYTELSNFLSVITQYNNNILTKDDETVAIDIEFFDISTGSKEDSK
jgi:hypothetical protein